MGLPRYRKVLLLEAALWLSLAWVLVRAVPFRYWSRWLGHQAAGEADMSEASRDIRVKDICWSISTISRLMRNRYTCLMLAMTAQWMMHRRHISCCLVLGALTCNREQRLSLKAHAWVRDATGVVLGDLGESYVPISSFMRRYPASSSSRDNQRNN
ncbi:lasso peptide biosynthesis B2 protein [Billgrantia kenyensis]|uniref:lasso peptide biosynthesis B2 protein n=1 Tax=Billgrantia kenyensis TaxID=321266 RepID=UPI003BEF3A06